MLHIGRDNPENKTFRIISKEKTHPHGQVFLFMESGNVLLSQVFPHVLDPPPAAHMGEPNQVQCCTLIEDDQRVRTLQME